MQLFYWRNYEDTWKHSYFSSQVNLYLPTTVSLHKVDIPWIFVKQFERRKHLLRWESKTNDNLAYINCTKVEVYSFFLKSKSSYVYFKRQ
jgi:hypothetical protein